MNVLTLFSIEFLKCDEGKYYVITLTSKNLIEIPNYLGEALIKFAQD